jgi:hypothetical protein
LYSITRDARALVDTLRRAGVERVVIPRNIDCNANIAYNIKNTIIIKWKRLIKKKEKKNLHPFQCSCWKYTWQREVIKKFIMDIPPVSGDSLFQTKKINHFKFYNFTHTCCFHPSGCAIQMNLQIFSKKKNNKKRKKLFSLFCLWTAPWNRKMLAKSLSRSKIIIK